MAYASQGLGGVIGHTVNMGQLDAYTVAVTYGILPNTQAGLDAFNAAHTAVTRGGRHALLLANPKLAALLASWMGTVEASELGWDDNTLTANMLLVNNNIANSDEVLGMWTDVWGSDPPGTYGADPTSPGARYVAAVNQFVGVFFNMAGAVADYGSQPNPGVQASMQWNAALARGATRLPTGNAQGYLDVPTEFITAGPTTLPDGEVYAVVNDPRRAAAGESPTDVVVWGHGPTWKPLKISFPSPDPASVDRFNMQQTPQNVQGRNPWVITANNDLVQLPDPGTGSWYVAGVMGEADTTLPPVGWTGNYVLPSRVVASLQVGGQAPGVPIPVSAPVSPNMTPYTPPVVPSVFRYTGPPINEVGFQPTPNIDPVTGTDLQPIIPAMEVHDVTSGQVVAAPVPPALSPLLLLGGIGALLYFGSKRGH